MKKISYLMLIVFMMMIATGCSNTGSSKSVTVTNPPTDPVEPTEPEPEVPGVPDVGIGSVDYIPSCNSGFAYIVYVFRADSTIDNNSFVIVHSINGVRTDITTGAVFTNGSISRMEEEIYIPVNETEVQKAHQLRVEFISDGINQVNSFSFMQPPCDVVAPPIEPTPEPEPEPVPDPEPIIDEYQGNTDYGVNQYITILDDSGIKRLYRCITAYRSGPDDSWEQFQHESEHWTQYVVTPHVSMKVEIK